MSLSKPALIGHALESSALALWHEWLGLWFDGAAHELGAEGSIVFPKAEFLYQQAQPPQPQVSGAKGTPLSLHVVMITPSRIYRAYDHDPVTGRTQEWGSARGQFLVYARCSATNAGQGNAARQCAVLAERLAGLCNNSAGTKPMAEKGLHRLSATLPALVAAGEGSHGRETAKDFATRLVSVSARLRWWIRSQGRPLATGPGVFDDQGAPVLDSEGQPLGDSGE